MFTKHFSPIGPAVWPAIGNIYTYECLVFYYIGYRLIISSPHASFPYIMKYGSTSDTTKS